MPKAQAQQIRYKAVFPRRHVRSARLAAAGATSHRASLRRAFARCQHRASHATLRGSRSWHTAPLALPCIATHRPLPQAAINSLVSAWCFAQRALAISFLRARLRRVVRSGGKAPRRLWRAGNIPVPECSAFRRPRFQWSLPCWPDLLEPDNHASRAYPQGLQCSDQLAAVDDVAPAASLDVDKGSQSGTAPRSHQVDVEQHLFG